MVKRIGCDSCTHTRFATAAAQNCWGGRAHLRHTDIQTTTPVHTTDANGVEGGRRRVRRGL